MAANSPGPAASGPRRPSIRPVRPKDAVISLRIRQNTCMRFSIALVLLMPAAFAADSGWSVYGGDAGGTRYSHLKQITRENIAQLKAVWTYHTGALKPVTDLNQKAAFEATPILVDGILYLSTPFN